MREIRLPGSEGGALVTNVPTPYPLQLTPIRPYGDTPIRSSSLVAATPR